MATENLSGVLHGPENFRLEKRPVPEINDDQVLLAMQCVGICGSDVHFLVHGHIGDYYVKSPMVLGHEGAAIVSKVGKNVTTLKPGDRVAVEMQVPCRVCILCKSGRYNLCEEMRFGSCPPEDGCLSEYFVHYPDFCFKLPDSMTLEEGALVEPLSVGLHACRRANVVLGSTVVIFGSGPIGLVTVVVAKSMGASKVLITDVVENRLITAKKLGADYTLLTQATEDEKDIVARIHQLIGKPDVTIDCTGKEATNRLSILTVRNGGCAMIVGNGPLNVNLPLMNGLMREVDIRGVFRYSNTYPAAIALLASSKIDLKQIITHRFEFTDALNALSTSRHGLEGAIKCMIHIQKQST